MSPASSNTRDSNTPRSAKRAIPTTEATSPNATAKAIHPRSPRVNVHRRRSKYIGNSLLIGEHSRRMCDQKGKSGQGRLRPDSRARNFPEEHAPAQPEADGWFLPPGLS